MEGRQKQNTWPVVLLVFVIITATYLFMITRTTLWDREPTTPKWSWVKRNIIMAESAEFLPICLMLVFHIPAN